MSNVVDDAAILLVPSRELDKPAGVVTLPCLLLLLPLLSTHLTNNIKVSLDLAQMTTVFASHRQTHLQVLTPSLVAH